MEYWPNTQKSHTVQDWEDLKEEEELDKAAIKREVKRLEKEIKKYTVSESDNLPEDTEEGRFRILYWQLQNASTKEMRAGTISGIQSMNKKHSMDVYLQSWNTISEPGWVPGLIPDKS